MAGPGNYTQKQLEELARSKGGMVGETILDPFIEEKNWDKIAQKEYTTKVANTDPTIRITFADNTFLTVKRRAIDTGDNFVNAGEQTYDIVDDSPALEPSKASSQTGQIVTASSSQRYITERTPDGHYRNVANPNYVEPKEADPYQSSSVIAAGISAATQRLINEANLAWDREKQNILSMQSDRTYTQTQLEAKADEAYKRIDLDLRRSIAENENKVTLRGQEMTARGQDINAATDLADTTVKAWGQALPYMGAKGSNAAFGTALNNIGNPNPQQINVPGMDFPFDPSVIAQQAAARALGQTGGSFTLPGKPAMPTFSPVPGSENALPVFGNVPNP